MENNKITVQDFIINYNKCEDVNKKLAYTQTLMNDDAYVPFEAKQVQAESILKTAHTDAEGNVLFNSCKEYMMKVYTLMENYTNIQVSSNTWVVDFNLLHKTGAIQDILASIPPKEHAHWDFVYSVCKEDFIDNHCSNGAIVNNLMKAFQVIGQLMNGEENG